MRVKDPPRAATVLNGNDLDARVHLALAANYAGIGSGNAGVHIPHAVAYPIAGLILTAPSAFRFTYATAPER